jgi:hypothetical protein
MNTRVAEWLWRIALLCALAVIGWELRQLHEDLNQPVDDSATVAAGPDDVQDSLDAVRDDIATLTQKVDAILVVMARAK